MRITLTLRRTLYGFSFAVMFLTLVGCEPTGTTDATTFRIEKILAGSWRAEGEDTTISFTNSGTSKAIIGQHLDTKTATIVGECTLMYQFNVKNYKDIYDEDHHPMESGAYISQSLTGYRGDCHWFVTNVPDVSYVKIDVVDSNHISLGTNPKAFVRII